VNTSSSVQRVLAPLCLLVAATLSSGCGSACDDAQQLCEDCELDPQDCEPLYAEASAEFCEDAVDTYEASCGE